MFFNSETTCVTFMWWQPCLGARIIFSRIEPNLNEPDRNEIKTKYWEKKRYMKNNKNFFFFNELLTS